jgi:hypothetical protein
MVAVPLYFLHKEQAVLGFCYNRSPKRLPNSVYLFLIPKRYSG